MAETFFWHDYETFGNDPARTRPAQFAGLRTDADLNPVGAPLVLYCRPSEDFLPDPDACLITGITPQRAARAGLGESAFAEAIRAELAVPGTCGVGYNSLHFDDEVTRHLFYRNLLDPYAHAWQNGNSRFDLIAVLRLARALRPDGLVWPEREPGVPSFRLEDLTAANQIPHADAHDAMADVQATLALARRLKAAQPRLLDWALSLRRTATVQGVIDRAKAKGEPLLHVSQRYPAAQGCLAPVWPVATDPANPRALLCFDLRQTPDLLLDLDVEALRTRLFSRSEDLPDGTARLGLKGVKTNAVPMLAPLGTLSPALAERWGIDPQAATRHARVLAAAGPSLAAKVQAVVAGGPPQRSAPADPELALYDGFFSDPDRRAMAALRALPPSALAEAAPRFQDPRLPVLAFRWRARNWPETLSDDERADWDAWRLERLTDPEAGSALVIDAFERRIAELRQQRVADPAALALLDELQAWAAQVLDSSD